MIRLFSLLLFILLVGLNRSSATHIVGGELVYTHLSGNQYAITLIVYRDCLGGQAPFDNPASVGIFNSSGTLVQNISIGLDSVVTLQSTINSSCVTVPNNVCTEAGYYTEIVNLPPIPGGYTISYQRCCRNSVVQNVVDPGDVGATYVATIPGTESSPSNSSPVWNNLPPLYVCVNLPFQFNHSAFDLDGDSLVYSLCTPYEGATASAPQPNPPGAPPYTPITWSAPFSLTDMLGGPVPLTIDPVTGQLNATPNSVGTYVIGMCVQEYRNGVLLGETRRGIQVNVVNCQAPVAMPDDLNEIIQNSFTNCSELVEFSAASSTGFSIWWDFGDPTTTTDQSTQQSPSYTYPGPGAYDLTLVVYNSVNPNDPLCTDTTVQQITIQDPVTPNAGSDTSTCPGISVQIGTPAQQGWTYQWSPSTGLDNATTAQPTATIAQQTTYTVTAFDAVGCSGSEEVTIDLLLNASASAGPDVQICPGDTAQLNASGGVSFQWSPATFISNTGIAGPLVFPPATTEYVVGVTNSDGCVGLDTVVVEVFVPSLSVSTDPAICIGDTVQLIAVGALNYQWSPNYNISQVNVASPLVSPQISTTYSVQAVDANGCQVSESVLVTVNQLPEANAGPNQEVCIGESVVLQGSGGVNYQWSPATFLDDPNAQLPISTPEQTMTYTLNVTDANNCADSDEMIVTVNPIPVVDAGVDSMICANGSLVLHATGAETYLWSPLVGISDPQSADPTASPLSPTVYVVTGTDVNGCANADSVSITIFGVTAGPDSVVCLNDSVQVSVSGGASFSWTPSDGVSDPTIASPYMMPNGTTTYTVNVVSEFGCEASAEVTIGILTLPVSAFTATFEPSCDGIYAEFQNQSENAEDYFWNLGDGSSSTEVEPSHTYESGPGGVVILYTFNNDGLCSDSVVVDFSDQWFGNDSIDIQYSTVFTPNYDGINDCFRPGFDGRYSDCYDLQVYNRWGALIFESTGGQNHCWDGRTKGGKMCDEGTYYYISSIKGYKNHGYVTLIY